MESVRHPSFFPPLTEKLENEITQKSPKPFSTKKLTVVVAGLKHLQEIGVSTPGLDKTLCDLKALEARSLSSSGKIDKPELERIKLKIQEAIETWLGYFLDLGGNVDNATSESNLYGFKYSRLKQQEQLLRKVQLTGVVVPLPMGISTHALHSYLKKAVPDVEQKWEELQVKFANFKGENRALFLSEPEVENSLKEIQRSIEEAFQEEVALSFLGEVEGLNGFIEHIKDQEHYLMVRSSGAEDLMKVANAGGNLSLSYVQPEARAVLKAVGQVVASYYGIASLRNRLNSEEENPFGKAQHIAVCLQELIGEKPLPAIDEGKKEPSPPISVVLFSNEPTYVGDEPFRVMRLSATYGHGEGVVGAAGVRTDTYMLLCSNKDPTQIYILQEIAVKDIRLAPVIDKEGVVTLQRVPNSDELIGRPALNNSQLALLFQIGRVVEVIYGGKQPMDMELVVKGSSIYPVQARPIKRPKATPSYVDVRAAKKQQSLALELFLPGKADVQKLANGEELLIVDTLEEAQTRFNTTLHKMVVIRQEEPANSHPVVNFSGMGIPVMYSKDHEALRTFIKESLNGDKMLLVCIQTGTLWAIDNSCSLEALIKQGYAIHPARIVLSIDRRGENSPLRKGSEGLRQLPQELKRMLTEIKAMQVDEKALSALKELKYELNETLEQKNRYLKKVKEQDGSLPYQHELEEAIELWKAQVKNAFSEWKHFIKRDGEGEQRLEHLWHAKIVEELIVQHGHKGCVGNVSLISLNEEIAGLEHIAAHCSRHGGSEKCRFSEETLYRGDLMTAEQTQQWDHFLDHLEVARAKGLLKEEEILSFKEGLKRLDTFELVPLWMAQLFLPNFDMETEEKAVSVFKEVCSHFPGDDNLYLFQKLNAKISALEENSSLFASPEHFEKMFNSLKEITAEFTSLKELPEEITPAIRQRIRSGDSQWKGIVENATAIERLMAYRSMERVVTLYDGSIKAMKSSQILSNEEKITSMKRMLSGYYALLADWHHHLSGQKIAYHNAWPLDRYLGEMERLFNGMGNRTTLLNPSPAFSVSAARLGAITVFDRAFPKTLEDFFTLTHQNLITAINALGVKEFSHVALPEVLEQFTQSMEIFFNPLTPEVQIIGCEVTEAGVNVRYNYPQRSHSIQFTLSFNKRTGESVCNILFVGVERQNRWGNIADLANLYEEMGRFSLISSPIIKPLSLEINIKLDANHPKSSDFALLMLRTAAAHAMGRSIPLDYALPKSSKKENSYNPFNYLQEYRTLKKEESRKWSLSNCMAGGIIPKNLRDDKEFLLELIKRGREVFASASERLKRDPGFVLAAVRKDSSVLKLIKDWRGLESVKEEIYLAVVEQNGLALREIDLTTFSETTREKLIFTAVEQNGLALKYIDLTTLSETNREKLIFAAVQQNGLVLGEIDLTTLSKTTRKKLLFEAVGQNGLALKYIDLTTLSETTREKLIFAAVEQNGLVLGEIDLTTLSETTREKLIFAAVQQNGLALEFVNLGSLNTPLQKKIILLAVQQNGEVLNKLKIPFNINAQNREEMDKNTQIRIDRASAQQRGVLLMDIIEIFDLEVQEEIILAAVRQNGMALEHVSLKRFNKNVQEKIALAAIQQNGIAGAYVPKGFMLNESIVLEMVRTYPIGFKRADSSLKNDPNFVFKAILQNPRVMTQTSVDPFKDQNIEEESKKWGDSPEKFFVLMLYALNKGTPSMEKVFALIHSCKKTQLN